MNIFKNRILLYTIIAILGVYTLVLNIKIKDIKSSQSTIKL